MDNGSHFSGERHAIAGEVLGDPNRTVVPVVTDAQGRLLVDLSASPIIDIGIVQIEDSAGNPLTSVAGSLNVNVTNAGNATNLTEVGGAPISEGQKTMANSLPVVIASDQSPIAVTGTITTSPNVNVHDGSGNTIASTGTSLNVDVTNTVPVTLASTTITGNVTVVQPTGTNLHTVVDSGSITANAGTNLNTSALALDTTVAALEVGQGSTTSGQKGILELGAVTTAPPTYTTGQTSPLSLDTSGNLRVSGTSTVSGSVTANQGTPNTLANAWPVELSDGTNLLGVSAHPVRVDPTGTTIQPVSGTVTANAGTGNFTVTQATGTNLHTVLDSGTLTSITNALPAGTNVIGHVIADSGSTTAVTGIVTVTGNKPNNNTAPSSTNISVLPALANASSPSWSEGGQVMDSVDLTGRQRVRGTLTNNNAAPSADNVGVLPAIANASAPSLSEGDQVLLSTDLSGTLRVSGGGVAQGSTTSGQIGPLVQGAVTTDFPTHTTAQTSPLSLTTSGALRVDNRNNNIATYAGVAINIASAATATDIFTLTGSATKTVKIIEIIVTGSQTTAGNTPLIGLLRSTANSGGTSTAPTITPYDSNNAAATATFLAYTANPSTGVLVGNVFAKRLEIVTLTGGSDNQGFTFTTAWGGQPIVLRGTSQVFALNLNGVTVTGGTFTATIIWTEE